jgi:hypothetical protein
VRETRSDDEVLAGAVTGVGDEGARPGDEEKSLLPSEKKLDCICCPVVIVWDAARNERSPERDDRSDADTMVMMRLIER